MLAIVAALKSKVTEYLLIAATVVAILFGVYRVGRKTAQADIDKSIIQSVQEKVKTDAEVDSMSADDRRAKLVRWGR